MNMKQNTKKAPNQIDLTIVIPALREEHRIGRSLDELARFLKKDPTHKKISTEVLVVSANGGDKTHEIVKSKRTKFANLKLLRPGKVVGKGRDVQYGMLRAKGAAVLFMDADLATPLPHISKFYKAFLKGADVVVGTRNLRRHHPGYFRRLVSNVGNLLFRIFGGVWIEDSQCGFKLFSANAAKLCFSRMTILRWGFDMEVLTIARTNKLTIKTYRINDWVSVPEGTFNASIFHSTLDTLKELGQILLHRSKGDYRAPEPGQDTGDRAFIKKFSWFVIMPGLLYLLLFVLMQPNHLMNFSRSFYLDSGDGYQNVWNIWWVNKSVLGPTHNPYWTNMLQWPFGTTLIPQTMNLINGLLAIPLIRILHFSLIEAVNTVVLFSFVASGITMAWFIHKLYGKYHVSLIAGGLFTFSSYHMSHSQGHLQLMTTQYIPLFLLIFWKLVEKPKYRYAVLSALALATVMLSDYYYLIWCIMIGGLWAAWSLYKKQLSINRHTIKVFSLFAVMSLVLIGPLTYKLSKLSKPGVLLGAHDPVSFSLDPLTIIIPGGSWFLSSLTRWHWSRLPYLSEMSVYFGLALIVLLFIAAYGQVFRKRFFKKAPTSLLFWWGILFIFAILALGPRPHLFGRHLLALPLPYAGLEQLWPTLKISGMPVRWIFISHIAAIVIASYVLTLINLKRRKGQLLLGLFVLFSLFELWPGQLPMAVGTPRPYVTKLTQLPYGAVIDNGAVSSSQQLFNQTVHEKPIAFGYVTRIPKDVDEKNFHIFAALEQGRHQDICRLYKIRYVTEPVFRPLKTKFPVIYNDNDTLIYDFKNSVNC